MLASALLFAQSPTIVSSDIPVAGQSFAFIEATYLEITNNGIGQTWDLSGITQTGSGVQTWNAPSSSTAAANFPDADLVIFTGAREQFVQFTSSSSFILGSQQQGIISTCSDPMERMKFPCTYGTSWSDNGTCSYTDQGTEYPSTTVAQFEADGYGTLILPNGTVNNVLKLVESSTSTAVSQGFTYTQTTEIHYFWKPGVPTYVAGVSKVSLAIDGQIITGDEEVNYLSPSSIGIEDLFSNDLGISLFPNPANSVVSVDISAKGKLDLEMFDTSGRCVKMISLGSKAPGIHRHEVDVNDLVPGIYTVNIRNEHGERGSQRLLVQ